MEICRRFTAHLADLYASHYADDYDDAFVINDNESSVDLGRVSRRRRGL